MNVALWVAQILLALVFLAAGVPKALQPKDKLAERMAFVEDVSAGTVKALGVLETLAAVGLVLPPFLGIAPILAPLAAAGLVLTMVGAAVTHHRRNERQQVLMNVLLGVLAVFVAWGRFGPHAF